MTKTKSTKRALLMSALALLVCVTMLIGSTFAWFTDSVTTGSNIIKSGNLDVDLIDASGASMSGEIIEFVAKDGRAQSEILWEPGCTYKTEPVRVVNKGNLALKYKITISGITGDAKLLEVIDWTVTIDGVKTDLSTFEGNLYPETGSDISGEIVLSGHMKEEAGNDYENLTVENIAISVYATQFTAEYDSFNNEYDKFADYDGEISNAVSLAAAMKNGGTYKLLNNITLDSACEIPQGVNVNLNLNGNDITTTAAYDSANATASSAIVNNGVIVLVGNGTVKATNNYTVRNYGTMTIDGITVENGIMNFADLTVENGNISNSRSGKHTIYGNAAKLTINGGKFHNDNPGNAGIFAYAGEVEINGGEFTIADGTATLGWTSCLIDAQGSAKYTINGGVFNGEIRDYNKNTTINGGTFSKKPSNDFIAAGTAVLKNSDGSFTVYAAGSSVELEDGATLDLGGKEFNGTVVAKGDLTVKGDTKIKTLKSTAGGTITVEDGKTLTLNNFSFGAKDNASAKYTITGGTIEASYGFFQHGTYELKSDFETGYMYYSYGSDITVYGTFHSQGKGDGLDYVRGKLTIANGGKSIHDKSLWIGQPASWGAMNATLIVEEGGYVQANSISVYDGSVAYNSSANNGIAGVGVKYNSLTGTIDSF